MNNNFNNKNTSTKEGTNNGAHPLDGYTKGQTKTSNDNTDNSSYYKSQVPEISLPKGGGALQSISEKFKVNAVNGSASFSIPLPLTEGRNGFTPSLSISYNSGSGNSEFGLGCALSLPTIQRKTEKKLPEYNDAKDSDTFLLSGYEDLVPAYNENNLIDEFPDSGYTIKRYRPRIEGAFSRIEFITDGSENWWRVISKDNIVTYYGLTADARIADPEDSTRVFKWLPELVCDYKGNIQRYSYISEDLENVVSDVHEKNRSLSIVAVNKYPKKVQYCNEAHYDILANTSIYKPVISFTDDDFLMEAVFDYGDHADFDYDYNTSQKWSSRKDAFSDYHSGFEVRTYRQCQRVLVFNRFKELNNNVDKLPVLVRSVDFTYKHDNTADYIEADYIVSVTQNSYKKNGSGYYKKSLPKITIDYNDLSWNTTIQSVSHENVKNSPQGLTDQYQWIDLWGEGISGILTEQGSAWYYKGNNGDGDFTSAVQVAEKPSLNGLGKIMQWQDLDADGRRQVVIRDSILSGYCELNDDDKWEPFTTFDDNINIDWKNPYTKLIDLDGDGRPDLLITEDNAFVWYKNNGKAGHVIGGKNSFSFDEEDGPRLLLNDLEQSIFLADMSGDGMTDLVRIKNGSICYWPNMGYGKFGSKVTMSNAPLFDNESNYNPKYLNLVDISGTGATDIIYIGNKGARAWMNLSGNAWSVPTNIDSLPGSNAYDSISVVDFLGNGTGCVVWSSSLPQYANAPLRYIDLMGGNKPYLMNSYTNGMGKTVSLSYKSSTKYYLAAKLAGTPWATKLPFPVHLVSSVNISDAVSETSYTQTYNYWHGYYDHEEREFRGFGRVDIEDTESASFYNNGAIENSLDQPTVLTKTWYHTGAYLRERSLLEAYQAEYFDFEALNDVAYATLPNGLNAIECREAHRALKGYPLRTELYALDVKSDPYTISTYAYRTKLIQGLFDNNYACFYTYQEQKLDYHCEGDVTDVRLLHDLTLSVDDWGNVTENAQVVYPRSDIPTEVPSIVGTEQNKMLVTYTNIAYTNDVTSSNEKYRLRLPCENKVYEIHNLSQPSSIWTPDSLSTQINSATEIDFSANTSGATKKRLIAHQRTLFKKDDAQTVLNLEQLESLAIPHSTYSLGLTDDAKNATYGTRLTPAMLSKGGYLVEASITAFQSSAADKYWLSSGTVTYDSIPLTTFYTPQSFVDPWGNTTMITYWDNYYLLPKTISDPKSNTTTVEEYDWRCLQPMSITDANSNITDVMYDTLCIPVAMALRGKGTILDVDTEADNLKYIDDKGTPSNSADDTIEYYLNPESQTDIDNQELFWSDPKSYAALLLGKATWRVVYDFSSTPAAVAMIGREEHDIVNANSNTVVRITYTDGLGRVAMNKSQAEDEVVNNNPEDSNRPNGSYERWVSSGKTVYNNKGKVVLQYEPYYDVVSVKDTPGGFEYNPAVQVAEINQSVSPRMYYDPLGRLYKTEMPDGSFTKVEWTAWCQTVYDNNDTVLDSSWYTVNSSGSTEEQDAAAKALVHDDTPTVIHLDTLARPFYTIQKNAYYDSSIPGIAYQDIESYVILDIEGNQVAVHDARGLTSLEYKYSQIKAPVSQYSIDSGQKYVFVDAAGQPLFSWDADDRLTEIEYDTLRRPSAKKVTPNGGSEILLEQFTYGEGQTNPHLLNLRGQLYKHEDGAGTVIIDEYDFKGNPIKTTRTFVADATTRPDWNVANTPESDSYITETVLDAFNRPVSITNKIYDGATHTTQGITNYTYEASGQLFSVDVGDVRGTDQDIINKIEYNAKGQRIMVQYQHQKTPTIVTSTTKYTYDPKTFKVKNIRTTRSNETNPNDAIQDLWYWYDPVGNITMQKDNAQQTIFYANSIVKAENDYTYDALYRLIQASGRQHESSTASPVPSTYNDTYRVNIAHKADETKMRNYTQYHEYDEVGNTTKIKHTVTVPQGAPSLNWTRTFDMDAANNRMLQSETGSALQPEFYDYDSRGNMIAGMDHIAYFDYNDENRLAHVKLQDGKLVYYQYDGNGQRVRKQIVNGTTVETRKYLGNVEVYTKTIGGVLKTERESLHVNDDTTRVVLIETPVVKILTPAEEQVVRYQFTDHLGTASLELDEKEAAVITYEEYFPYGSTSFQSVNSTRTLSMKRYRYTGKEKDEETGLYYHGARYYAPWLVRWTAVDPLQSEMPTWSSYCYGFNNPITWSDPTGMVPGNGPGDGSGIDAPIQTSSPVDNTGSATTPVPDLAVVGFGDDPVAHGFASGKGTPKNPIIMDEATVKPEKELNMNSPNLGINDKLSRHIDSVNRANTPDKMIFNDVNKKQMQVADNLTNDLSTAKGKAAVEDIKDAILGVILAGSEQFVDSKALKMTLKGISWGPILNSFQDYESARQAYENNSTTENMEALRSAELQFKLDQTSFVLDALEMTVESKVVQKVLGKVLSGMAGRIISKVNGPLGALLFAKDIADIVKTTNDYKSGMLRIARDQLSNNSNLSGREYSNWVKIYNQYSSRPWHQKATDLVYKQR